MQKICNQDKQASCDHGNKNCMTGNTMSVLQLEFVFGHKKQNACCIQGGLGYF